MNALCVAFLCRIRLAPDSACYNLLPHQRLGAYLVGLALAVDVVDVVAADEVGLVARVVRVEAQALADLGAGAALAVRRRGGTLVVDVVVGAKHAQQHEHVEGRVAQGVEQDRRTRARLVGEVEEARVLEGAGLVGEVWAGAVRLEHVVDVIVLDVCVVGQFGSKAALAAGRGQGVVDVVVGEPHAGVVELGHRGRA